MVIFIIYKVKPFLKWVGGKTQLLKKINNEFPDKFNTYIEPFIGGGSIFFKIVQKYGNSKKYYISDINTDLITSYKTIRDNVDEVIININNLNKTYTKLDKENQKIFYYKIRNDFNSTINNDIEKTSQMIFLNKTSFNGVFRVNSNGKFNVPFNFEESLYFDFDNLINVSNILNRSNVVINNFDFSKCGENVNEDTFIYLDPPYHNTFTTYTKHDFLEQDQLRLLEFYKSLDKKHVKIMLSSSDTEFIRKHYNNFNIKIIEAKRFINSDGNNRGNVNELLITNYKKNHRTLSFNATDLEEI